MKLKGRLIVSEVEEGEKNWGVSLEREGDGPVISDKDVRLLDDEAVVGTELSFEDTGLSSARIDNRDRRRTRSETENDDPFELGQVLVLLALVDRRRDEFSISKRKETLVEELLGLSIKRDSIIKIEFSLGRGLGVEGDKKSERIVDHGLG